MVINISAITQQGKKTSLRRRLVAQFHHLLRYHNSAFTFYTQEKCNSMLFYVMKCVFL